MITLALPTVAWVIVVAVLSVVSYFAGRRSKAAEVEADWRGLPAPHFGTINVDIPTDAAEFRVRIRHCPDERRRGPWSTYTFTAPLPATVRFPVLSDGPWEVQAAVDGGEWQDHEDP